MALTNKQEAFINEYLMCFNASEAAIKAGYSVRSAGSIGHENLNKPEIAEEIQKRVQERTMAADEVLMRLSDQARGAAQYLVEIKGTMPFLNWERLEAEGKLHLIKKLSYDRDGRPQVEFYDAQNALVQIGRILSLFKDNVQVTGAEGGPIDMRLVLEDLTDDDLDALLEA